MILRLKDTKLSVIDGSINGTGSANIPVELVNDEKFNGCVTSINVRYMQNADKDYAELEIPYNTTSKAYLFPSALFKYSGSIVIGVMNIKGSAIYNSEPLVLFVPKTPYEGDVLDDVPTMTWQEYVRNYINSLGGIGGSGGDNYDHSTIETVLQGLDYRPSTNLESSYRSSQLATARAIKDYIDNKVISGGTGSGISADEIASLEEATDFLGTFGGHSSGDSEYTKPTTGIPKADLSSGVQASLNRADELTDTYINQLIDNKINELIGDGVSY